MAESSASSGDARNRPSQSRGGASKRDGAAPRRDGGPRRDSSDRSGNSRDGKPGERKPWERREGKPSERKPWESRDGRSGERKPREDRDRKPGERKPWEQREGKPGERKPWEQRDGKPGERKPWERRDDKPGERKPWESREGKPGERRAPAGKPWIGNDGKPVRGNRRPDGERTPWEPREGRPERRDGDSTGPRQRRSDDEYVKPRNNDPELPDGIQPRDLDGGARAELKTLSKDNADHVAKHLVAAALALESDPELAHRHALAAARTAGRVAVVRETVAITAYECGDFALALRELRTYRRISGKNDHIGLIVDAERGLGRPERALEEGRAVDRASIPVESRVALAIAMSGARLDLGQPELALGELEIAELDPNRAYEYSPMLFHAYAEVLDELGRAKDSAEWRHRAEVAQAALDDAFPVDDVMEIFEEIDEAVAAVEAADQAEGELGDVELADANFENAEQAGGESAETEEA